MFRSLKNEHFTTHKCTHSALEIKNDSGHLVDNLSFELLYGWLLSNLVQVTRLQHVAMAYNLQAVGGRGTPSEPHHEQHMDFQPAM